MITDINLVLQIYESSKNPNKTDTQVAKENGIDDPAIIYKIRKVMPPYDKMLAGKEPILKPKTKITYTDNKIKNIYRDAHTMTAKEACAKNDCSKTALDQIKHARGKYRAKIIELGLDKEFSPDETIIIDIDIALDAYIDLATTDMLQKDIMDKYSISSFTLNNIMNCKGAYSIFINAGLRPIDRKSYIPKYDFNQIRKRIHELLDQKSAKESINPFIDFNSPNESTNFNGIQNANIIMMNPIPGIIDIMPNMYYITSNKDIISIYNNQPRLISSYMASKNSRYAGLLNSRGFQMKYNVDILYEIYFNNRLPYQY